MLQIVESLHGRGYSLRVFDPTVSHSALMGAVNRQSMIEHIPHIHEMLTKNHFDVLTLRAPTRYWELGRSVQGLLRDPEPYHRIFDPVGLDC